MAGRRTRRSDMPNDPAAVIRAMRSCRGAMIEVLRCVKPMGPTYHAASMVISAIDAMATLLTGERYYFSADGSASSGASRQEETMALAAGEGQDRQPAGAAESAARRMAGPRQARWPSRVPAISRTPWCCASSARWKVLMGALRMRLCGSGSRA